MRFVGILPQAYVSEWPQYLNILLQRQYASGDFQKQLSTCGMQGSMSRKGACWDNAVTETLFGPLKVERLHGMRFATRRQAKDEVIDWLRFYNHRRLHSTLGYLSPMAFEKKQLGDRARIAA